MIQHLLSFGIGIIVIMKLWNFVKNFISKDSEHLKKAMRLFNYHSQNPQPLDLKNPKVKTYLFLYQKFIQLFHEAALVIKKESTHQAEVAIRDIKQYYLDHAKDISQEVGVKGYKLLDIISEKIVKEFYNPSMTPMKKIELYHRALEEYRRSLKEFRSPIMHEINPGQSQSSSSMALAPNIDGHKELSSP